MTCVFVRDLNGNYTDEISENVLVFILLIVIMVISGFLSYRIFRKMVSDLEKVRDDYITGETAAVF